jgi:hypothetical protein
LEPKVRRRAGRGGGFRFVVAARRHDPRPSIGADDADAAFAVLVAEPQFGCTKQAVDDVVVAADAVVDQLGAAGRTDDEERRHLALADAGRELDIDLLPIVEGAQWPP